MDLGLFYFRVAGLGIEPRSAGYEPAEMPLLYPAIFLHIYYTIIRKKCKQL